MVATYTKWQPEPCILMVPSCGFFLYKITDFWLVAIYNVLSNKVIC